MLDREVGLDVAVAVRGEVGDATAAGHEDEPTGKEPTVDVVGEVGVQAAQALPIETDGGGIDFDGQITHDVPCRSSVRGPDPNRSRRRHR